ncbi:amino-acid permease inda1 [Ascoidea rubescens DSM 1968]|uniref:Amino-acid permease inda1 n=1 Tax=Ascoidea rubescens DSM 1968 TaxID=1344418 RepID=A0A1D2VRC4_9ASCO|nr:amino-acid permease inda1 [Ascoidea rubescens DSM 1968]ODV64162.1 amino-acid permease inda1 [Ascoidea rubescens DSM 1968]
MSDSPGKVDTDQDLEKNIAVGKALSLHSSHSVLRQGSVIFDEGDQNNVHRGLKSRHIQLIAIAGCIGTGLFVGSGAALSTCGPANLFMSYCIISFVMWIIMNDLGEMIVYLPLKGMAISGYVDRYVDKSLAFATGWCYWYTYSIVVAAESTAGAFIVRYWTDEVHMAIWITIFTILMVGINVFAVGLYGELEFWFGSIKVITIVGLIILGVVLFFGGGPNQHGVLGFGYWQDPGAFKEHIVSGHTGKFLAFITALVKSAFSFILSPELIAISGSGEGTDPRRNIKKATKRFVYRVIFFYICGSFIISVIVAYDDDRLMKAVDEGSSGAAASPFVIGIQNAGIPVLNHIINAVILTSAISAGNSLYLAASRSLFAMAKQGYAPKFFGNCNRFGVPYWAVLATGLVSLLSYLNCSNSASDVFTWLTNITTVAGFINWSVITVTYLRWRKAVQYNGLWDRVPFKTKLQPYASYFAFCFVIIISLVNGYAVFFPDRWNASDFVAAYITIPIFLVLWLGHKFFIDKSGSFYKKIEEIDVITGLEEVEAAEKEYPERIAKNFWQKFWFWLA